MWWLFSSFLLVLGIVPLLVRFGKCLMVLFAYNRTFAGLCSRSLCFEAQDPFFLFVSWHNSSSQGFLTFCPCEFCHIWPDKPESNLCCVPFFLFFLQFSHAVLVSIHKIECSVMRSTQNWIIAQIGRSFVFCINTIWKSYSFAKVGGQSQVYVLSLGQSESYKSLLLCHSLNGGCLFLLPMLLSA